MLIIVVGENKEERRAYVDKTLKEQGGGDVIVLDDMLCALKDLEQYVYPSLFSAIAPVVHAKFMFDGKHDGVQEVIKKLQSSPTIFILEEFSIPAAIMQAIKKQQAVVHEAGKKITKAKSSSTLFAVGDAITAKDKKSRWLAYREALNDYPPEAVIGILYWKVRDVILKKGNAPEYKKLYRDLVLAHARAWQTGTPLEYAIEKVLLEQ